jgi:hypothetical protein
MRKYPFSHLNNFPNYPSYLQSNAGYYEPWTEPYFGTGADGDLNTTGNVTLPSTTDGGYVTKNYNNLTINSGHTLTVSNRCKGLVLYVNGTFTLNGKLSMTDKGGNTIPLLPESFNIYVTKKRTPPLDIIDIISYQNLVIGNYATNSIPIQTVRGTSSWILYNGNNGKAGLAIGMGGDGGNGAIGRSASSNFGEVFNIAGMGNIYSGGPGAGGVYEYGGLTTTGVDYKTTGAGITGIGGNGIANNSEFGAGSGAGSPPGTPDGTYGETGETGKGGSIVLIARIFTGNGTVESIGRKGGNARGSTTSRAVGGGGSGGGPFTGRFGENNFTGNINTVGGLGGVPLVYSGYTGGAGGAGYISIALL